MNKVEKNMDNVLGKYPGWCVSGAFVMAIAAGLVLDKVNGLNAEESEQKFKPIYDQKCKELKLDVKSLASQFDGDVHSFRYKLVEDDRVSATDFDYKFNNESLSVKFVMEAYAYKKQLLTAKQLDETSSLWRPDTCTVTVNATVSLSDFDVH